MKPEDVKILGAPVVVSDQDVDRLEAQQWLTLPAGYREFITRFGEGLLCNELRIYPPRRILDELAEWRRRIEDYWFWDDGHDVMPKERALECVIIGDTLNGDQLIFHSGRPNRLFVLPHDSEVIFNAGTDLWSAIEWILESGELCDPASELTFEPFDSRTFARSNTEASPHDSGQSLADMVKQLKNWAKRQNAKKEALKEIGCHPHIPDDAKTELMLEGIIFRSDYDFSLGHNVWFRVRDNDTGKQIGVFRFYKGKSSSGSSYTVADSD